jgi:hypothetical protein
MADMDVRELPVVERENPGKIVSMVSRRDITRAYHNEMERRSTRRA